MPDNETVRFDARPAYAIHKLAHSSPIALEEFSIWERLSNAAYRIVTFWTPIVFMFGVYMAAMAGLHWVTYG